MKELISVCITTKNEERYIESCLKSILNQTYDGKEEIIVADSNSNDKTVEIAEKYADKIIVKDSTIAQGRNLAAKHAKGNILCFVDADVILSKNWFDTLIPHLCNAKIVVAYGDLYPVEKKLKAWIIYLSQEISNKIGRAIKKPNYAKMGSAVLIKRKVFEKIGGFKEDMTLGEDFDISLRLSKHGRLKFERKAKAYVSMRRFERSGYWKIMFTWFKNALPLFFGKKPSLIYTREFP